MMDLIATICAWLSIIVLPSTLSILSIFYLLHSKLRPNPHNSLSMAPEAVAPPPTLPLSKLAVVDVENKEIGLHNNPTSNETSKKQSRSPLEQKLTNSILRTISERVEMEELEITPDFDKLDIAGKPWKVTGKVKVKKKSKDEELPPAEELSDYEMES